MSSRTSRPSWNFTSARAMFFQSMFEFVLRDLSRAGNACAIIQPEGSILHLIATAPPDIATLPQAALTCQQYLQLKSGDLAIVNDPSSGSFSLSSFTVVTAASLPDGEVLIATRFDSSRKLGANGKLDEEGVRIPPTPIASKHQLNRDILNAIASHPAAPPQFLSILERVSLELFDAARKLERLAREPGSEINKLMFKQYLVDAAKSFEATTSRLPLGTANVSARVPGSNELIKLHLEVSEKGAHFDFKGTETSAKMGITELTTLGTCVWSTLALIEGKVLLNSSLLEHFNVSAPTGTLLAAKATGGQERGLSLLVPLLGELVLSALAKINTNLVRSSNAGSDALVQIDFSSGKSLTLSAAPGTGATASDSGTEAYAPWSAQRMTSIESIERNSLLTWTAAGVLKGSGGKGAKSGGDAELIAFRVREAAKVRFVLGRNASKIDGLKGGRSGAPGEIEVVRASGTKESFSAIEGTFELAPGDELRLQAAGGGAFGEPAEK